MKWKREQWYVDTEYEVTKFLWLPKTIGGQTRWLERATWTRTMSSPSLFLHITSYYPSSPWIDLEWKDTPNDDN